MNKVALLETKQLSCIRQNKSLFEAVSFLLQTGDALLIEGPNGAGKSSLLRLLAGIATPAAGNITWQGVPILHALSDYCEQLHYIGHANGIKAGLTIAENLTLAGGLSQHRISEIDTVLALLSLSGYVHTPTQFLSAGQKRRVALAKLFLIPRTLWILDEPFTALDVQTQTVLQDKIERHLGKGGACILTSHQPIQFNQQPLHRMALHPC